MKILGLTAFIHNSSAALLDDGAIVAAADEERFTREKFTGAFPREAPGFAWRRAVWSWRTWTGWRSTGTRGAGWPNAPG